MKWEYKDRATKTTIAGFEVSIHKYIGCGDMLFVSCYPLGIKQHDLHTEDEEYAKIEALRVVSNALTQYVSMYGEITEFLQTI